MNYKSVLSILRFASDIIVKLPTRDDSIPIILVKLVAIADSAHQRWAGSATKIPPAFAHHKFVEATNEPFVRLFFGTSLKNKFKLARWSQDMNREMIVATSATDERFIFQETQWGDQPHVSPNFHHTETVDFSAVMDDLWTEYPRGMYLSTEKADSFYGTEITYQEVSAPRSDVLTSKGEERFQEVLSFCRADIAAGDYRCYIASGPPGTGKSSFVMRLAEALGGRMLKIDASSIPRLGVQELGFVLNALRPRVLLIDDFDRAPVGATGARLLSLLEYLGANHAKTVTVITVNNPTALDPAMLRSERIDEPIDFTLPDASERQDLIVRLLSPDYPALRLLVSETEGMNHSDITDLCLRLSKQPLERVLRVKKRLREMAEAAAQKPSPQIQSGGLPNGIVFKTP